MKKKKSCGIEPSPVLNLSLLLDIDTNICICSTDWAMTGWYNISVFWKPLSGINVIFYR